MVNYFLYSHPSFHSFLATCLLGWMRWSTCCLCILSLIIESFGAASLTDKTVHTTRRVVFVTSLSFLTWSARHTQSKGTNQSIKCPTSCLNYRCTPWFLSFIGLTHIIHHYFCPRFNNKWRQHLFSHVLVIGCRSITRAIDDVSDN